MEWTEEKLSLLWLSSAEISAYMVHKLLEYWKTAVEIRKHFREISAFRDKTRERLEANCSDIALKGIVKALEEKKVRLLFQTDENYPKPLMDINDPPYLLYYAGQLSALDRPMVGIVGTRRASSYGQEIARSVAYDLCKAGCTVVSGLAYGIDAAAHRGALDAGGSTIGVLGSGINVPYPAAHRGMMREIAVGNGIVMSEYPLDAKPLKYHFPYRNRIISGLSKGVVYVEGSIKGGGMHTVAAALDQGKEVFAIPGKVGTWVSEGPNTIIREGARMVTSAEDILIDLGMKEIVPDQEEKTQEPELLNELQNRIYALLQTENMDSRQMSEKLQEDENNIITELGMMEINGMILREAGNLFRLPIQ